MRKKDENQFIDKKIYIYQNYFVLIASINNLQIGYTFPLIKSINLDIELGEKLLICGSNGIGKSTFLKTLLGIIKPFSGRIVFFGKKNIAYCKQDFVNSELPVTAREIVEMGTYKNKKPREFVDECMKKTQCWDLQKRLFNTLSGGEKQRVSLARCLCQSSSFLLLDEPSSFLDAKSKEIFIQLLHNMEKEKITIIAVTHDEEIIKSLKWKTLNFDEWRI